MAKPKTENEPERDASTQDGEDDLLSVVAPLLEEVRGLCEAILPAGHRDDFELAVRSYLLNHPVLRERLHLLRALRNKESGVVGTEPAAPPAAKKRRQGA